MWCADCESITNYFYGQTTFWLFLPTVDSFGKIASFCGGRNLDSLPISDHCIRVTIPFKQDIDAFLIGLGGCLNGPELAATKITTTSTSEEPGINDVAKVVSAQILINRFKGQWLVDSVEQELFETWFQPIIKYNRTESEVTNFANEGLFRLRDTSGSQIAPDIAFSIAEASSLLFSLDLVARRSAVECAAKAKLKGKIFINFNPSSVYDPAFCLRSTASAISALGLKPQDVVFEITETHRATDINHLKGILSFYRNAGFKVALDDIGSGWSGLNLLHEMRPDYVKIDMELIRDIHTDSFKQEIVKSLIGIAHSHSIQVISEGIEVQEEAEWLHGAGTDFMQGYFFGRPTMRENVLTESETSEVQRSLQPLIKAASHQ